MKIIRICGILALLLAYTLPVLAQSPTPTWEPLWPTPTPGEVTNYDCPDGVPIGYGTTTPEADWLLNCYNCLPVPEGTQLVPTIPWPTSQYTATPVYATPPPSPMPTPTYGGSTSFSRWRVNTCTNCGWTLPYYYDYYALGNFERHPNQADDQWTIYTQQYSYNQALNNPYDIPEYLRLSCYSEWTNGWDVSVVQEIVISTFGSTLETVSTPCGTGKVGDCYTELDRYYTGAQLYNGVMQATCTVRWSGNKLADQYDDGYVYISPTPLYIQPTPVPTAQSYCNSINGGYYYNETDPFAVLPSPIIGPSTCYGIPAFEFEGIGETIPAVTFPGLGVCFRSIEFGTLQLIGMNFNLDIIAAVLAGIAVIRIFLRS